jgi:hypothetical protein
MKLQVASYKLRRLWRAAARTNYNTLNSTFELVTCNLSLTSFVKYQDISYP